MKTVGVVIAAYPTGGFKGFYLQTPGTGGAVDLAAHTASDGLFVYSTTLTAPVAIGDSVSVVGTVSEFGGMTELTFASLALPATDAARESLEGMLIAPQGAFTVTNNYATNQYGEIGLAAGTTPLVAPTVTARPGTAEYTAAVAG